MVWLALLYTTIRGLLGRLSRAGAPFCVACDRAVLVPRHAVRTPAPLLRMWSRKG